MGNINREESEKIDRAILDCLETHTAMTAKSVAIQLTKLARDQKLRDEPSASKVSTAARKSGDRTQSKDKIKPKKEDGDLLFPVSTITNHLHGLILKGEVMHQEQGFIINKKWKTSQPKAYVFIITDYPQPKIANEQCHTKLVAEIQAAFEDGTFNSLTLVSAEIIMGDDYDIIVVVYGSTVTDIGSFVLGYLQGHRLVKKTHTVMVWPSGYEPPADPDHLSRSSSSPPDPS